MREVLPGRLWIGNSQDVRNWERVVDAGILTVIDLAAEEPTAKVPRSIVYCRFPLVDGEQDSRRVLRMAIEIVAWLLRGLEKVRTEWTWVCTAYNLNRLLATVGKLRAASACTTLEGAN
jgi:hypothetical protein